MSISTNELIGTISTNTLNGTGIAQKGDSGVSPVVSVVENTETSYKISITDNVGTITSPNLIGLQGIQGPQGPQGPQGQQGPQGLQGKTGKNFSIYKTYTTIDLMNADKANVAEGNFVLIASDTQDTDNAKLYVKGSTDFVYLTDLSGSQGIKGETGPQGPQGPQGVQGIPGQTGESNVLTIGTVSKGDEAAANISGTSPNQILNLTLPKGDKGDTGATGPQGTKGEDALLTHKYTLVEATTLAAGATITLPCYYKVGADVLDVYYCQDRLIKASSASAITEGYYAEVGTAGTISNQIQCTTDWAPGGTMPNGNSCYFEFVVRGEYSV